MFHEAKQKTHLCIVNSVGVFVAPTFPDDVPHGAKILQRQIQDNLKSASQNLSVLSTEQERLWHEAANP